MNYNYQNQTPSQQNQQPQSQQQLPQQPTTLPMPSQPYYQPSAPPAQTKSKKNKLWILIIIVVLILISGGIAFGYWKAQSGKKSSPVTPTASNLSGWKTYTNSVYGFSVKYPSNFSAVADSSKNTIVNDAEIVDINSLPDGGQTPTTRNYVMMVIKYSSDLSKYPNVDQELARSQQMFATEKNSVNRKIQSNGFEGVIVTTTLPQGNSSNSPASLEIGNLYRKISSGFYYISWSAGNSNNEGFTFANYGEPMLSTFQLTK